MKALHRPDFYCWSVFDAHRNIDCNTFLWVRHEGNILFDPLHISEHDFEHMDRLGGVSHIVLSSSDQVRDTETLRYKTGASVLAPTQERTNFPIPVDHWLSDNDAPFQGLKAIELSGSKTPGELAFLIDETTLVCGPMLRAPTAGSLSMLSPDDVQDAAQARASLCGLGAYQHIQAVLVTNGWPIFRHGADRLAELTRDL